MYKVLGVAIVKKKVVVLRNRNLEANSDNGTGQLKHSTINFTLPYCSPNSVIASFVPLLEV